MCVCARKRGAQCARDLQALSRAFELLKYASQGQMNVMRLSTEMVGAIERSDDRRLAK